MTSMDKIEIGKAIRVKDQMLVPIERTSIVHDTNERGCWCHGSKQLIALVVQTASGIQAFDMEAGPITMRELKNTVPEIEAYLTQNPYL